MHYKQQICLGYGEWDDLPNINRQNRFDSAEAAQADLEELFDDIRYAVAMGYMDENYDPADYRVVPVDDEN